MSYITFPSHKCDKLSNGTFHRYLCLVPHHKSALICMLKKDEYDKNKSINQKTECMFLAYVIQNADSIAWSKMTL